MPTTPKPAAPPAAKPAPVAPAPAPSPVPDGWFIVHRFAIDERFSNTQTIEAVAYDATGATVRTGPLIVQPEPAAIHAAMEVLDGIILEHIEAHIGHADHVPTIAVQLQQSAPELHPAPAKEPDPNAPATLEAIAEVKASILALTDEWQSYVLETFRIEFDLKPGPTVINHITTQAHCDFIRSMLPS